MKKLILLVITISFFTIIVYSQPKPISDAEYYSRYNTATEVSEKLERKIETKEINFTNGKPTKTVEMILEIINKEIQRFIKIEKNGSKVNKTEFVMFNSKIYKRKNAENWIKNSTWEDGSKDRVSMGESENSLEKIKLDNKNVTLLSSFTKFVLENKSRFTLYKIWIDENNRLLKVEFLSGLAKPKQVVYSETSTYFYNSKIVINNPFP